MKVFADLHHSDLYHSLYLLFEERLGGELYRPIDLDWFHEGFWKIAAPYGNDIRTVKQYLAIENTGWDMYKNLSGNHYIKDGVYYSFDPGHNYHHRAIPLKLFKGMKFDIIIASIPSHIGPYKKLIKKYQPNAKLIFQIGNPRWEENIREVDNVMCSTARFSGGEKKNIVFYHQEIDTKVFKYEPPTVRKRITSYVHYMQNLDRMTQYRNSMKDWRWKTYGAGMEDNLRGAKRVAEQMIKSSWIWHYKPRGDGFGHVIHSAYACGRPAIIDPGPYGGQPGGDLLEDLVTCLDFTKRSLSENVKLLREFSDPVKHIQICENAYKRFCNVVNYDEEEQEIRKFIGRLQ